MTCAECRDTFSAYVDEALSADARGALETHLAGCADCRREWQRFFATVDLLHIMQPERAPAGFVDRVVAAARPLPWYRRLARGLLVPWPVKLPLEAAAVVMVAGLAVLIFQRSAELQQMARPPEAAVATRGETQISEYAARQDSFALPVSPAPPAVATAPEKNQDAIAPRRQDEPRLAVKDSRDASAPRAKADAGRLESAPPSVAQQYANEPALARRQQAVEQERRFELRAPNIAATAPPTPSTPPPASGTAASSAPAPAPPAAAAAPAPTAKRATAPEGYKEDPAREADRGMAQGLMPGARERKVEEAQSELKKLSAVRGGVPANVELGLTVGDRAAAEAAVVAMVERLGGAVVPGASPGTLEIMVPRDAFATLTADLGRLGTLRTVRQPAELPESVRISLQLAN